MWVLIYIIELCVSGGWEVLLNQVSPQPLIFPTEFHPQAYFSVHIISHIPCLDSCLFHINLQEQSFVAWVGNLKMNHCCVRG